MRLLRASYEEIPDILREYQESGEITTRNISDLVVFSEGKISWESAWNLSYKQRKIFQNSIKSFHEAQNPSNKNKINSNPDAKPGEFISHEER